MSSGTIAWSSKVPIGDWRITQCGQAVEAEIGNSCFYLKKKKESSMQCSQNPN